MRNSKGETLFFQLLDRGKVLADFEPVKETTLGDMTKVEALLNKMSGEESRFVLQAVWVQLQEKAHG